MSKLICFIFLFFTTNTFALTNYVKQKSLFKDRSSHNVPKLSEQDKRISKNFNELLKLSKRGVINTRLFNKLALDIGKSKTFYNYGIWPKTILKIASLENTKKISNYCSEISTRDDSSHVQKYLSKNAAKVCYKKLIRKLTENSNVSMKLHNKFNQIIKKQAPFFFKHSLSSNLKYLLSRFKKNSPQHILYSNTLTDYFIESKFTPNVSLLSYMNINKELTTYLQTIDLNKSATAKVFLKEFRKITKNILVNSDKETPEAIINTQTQELIQYVNATFKNQPLKSFSNSYISFGKSLMRRKYYEAAREVFINMLQHKTPNSKKAVFELLWTYTYTQNYKQGLIAVKPFRYLYADQKDSKMTFWIAFAKYHSEDKEIAKDDFKKIIKHNPLSYYAILASKLLSAHNKDLDTKSIYVNLLRKNRAPTSTSSKKLNIEWIKRAIAWGDVSASTLLNLEIEDMIKTEEEDMVEGHLTSVARTLSAKKNYLESFKIIYRFVDRGIVKINESVLRILFPIPFIEQIKNQPREFDPIIALSLIRQESGFNRFAKSRVGARGLMQLMPGTAKRFKRRLKTKQLYNTNLNISIGTKYFQNLMNMFKNNLVYSLAAYNAGEHRVSDWQERDYVNNEESMLQNIENIPFLETRKYVKLIFRNIFFYKMLTEEPVKKDPFKLNRIYDIHVGFNK